MWNKIFNHKSKKSSFGSGSRKDRKNKSERVNDVDIIGSRLCSDSDDTSLSTLSAPISANSNSSSAKSKFSKVVNSFSLKRGSKENRNAVTIVECNSEIANGRGEGGAVEGVEGRFGSLKQGLSDEIDRIIIRKDHARINELLAMDEPTGTISIELKPCPICTRTFVPDTLKKHVNICEKMAMKKRKTFDSSKQRREGTDLANFLPKGYGLPETKRQHSLHQFHHQPESKNTMKLSQQISSTSSQTLQKQHDEPAKEPTSATSISSSPSTTATPNIQNKKSSSAVSQTATASIAKEAKLKAERKRNLLPPSEPCPYCERCFGIKAYDRHVEWCKEKARLLSNKNQTKTPAKERLEARIKYRAPCLKSKRTATREKYSGMSCDDTASIADSDHPKHSMSTSLSSSIMSESKTKNGMKMPSLDSIKNFSLNENQTFRLSNGLNSSSRILRPSYRTNTETSSNSPKTTKTPNSGTQRKNSVSSNATINITSRSSSHIPFKNSDLAKEKNRLKSPKKSSIPVRQKTPKTPQIQSERNSRHRLGVTECGLSKFKHNKIQTDEKEALSLIRSGTFNMDKRKKNEKKTNEKKNNSENSNLNFFQDFSTIEKLINENQKECLDSISNWSLCKSESSEKSNCGEFKIPMRIGKNDLKIFEKCQRNKSMLKLSTKSKKIVKEKMEVKNKESGFSVKKNFSKNQISKKSSPVKQCSPGSTNQDQEFCDVKSSEDILLSPASVCGSFLTCDGISDKYDPFLSAKRQLEELCSPTSTESPIIPVTPTTPTSTKLPSSLSSSFTSSQNTRNTSTTTIPQSSNFRRTSSLRVSRKKTPPTHHHKSSRPIFSQSKDRPTIQRGISDEGPISSNFLKPEEYDEMPVKSACVNDIAISHYQHHHNHHHHHNSPKVVKRDPNSNVNRRNIRLNLNNKSSSSSNVGISNPISKTDSLAIFLKYENDTKSNNNSSSSIIDSIPIVTSPLSPSPNNLTEKDIKDKTNTNLSKNQTISSNTKLIPSSINKIENVKNNFNIDNINNNNNNNNNNNRFKEINSVMTINKINPIKLEPILSNTKIISINSVTLPTEINSNNNNNLKSIQKSKNLLSSSSSSSSSKNQNPSSSLNLNSILNSKDTTDFIDPKLINFCDNLPINITKISDSDFTSSSSTDSVSTTKYKNSEIISTTITNNIQQQQQQQQQQQKQQKQQKEILPTSNRNSSEKRNLLNRQLRLDKNQFLYDISPDYDDDNDDNDNDDNNDVIIDSYSDQCDKTISIIDTNDKNYNKNNHINNDEPPTFDDFDFEEFLSSFDENDEEQYPIFKDYKKFLMMNRSLNKKYDNEQQQQQQQQTINNETNNNLQISLNRSSTTTTTIGSDIKNINNDDDVEEFCDNDDLDLESHKNEIFISIETNHNDDVINSNPSLIIPLNPLSHQEQQQPHNDDKDDLLDEEKDCNKTEKSNELTKNQLIDLNRNNNTTKNYIEQIEKINNNENDLKNNNQRNTSTTSNDMIMFQLQDSDEICSSVDENFLAHDRNSGSMHSKQNAADSAYGSLSRHSPIDPMIRRNSSRQRQPITNILPTGTSVVIDQQQQSPILKPKYSTSLLWNEPITKRRNRNFSASSSGSSSDNSLSAHHHHHHNHHNQHQSQKSEEDQGKFDPQQQQQSGKMSKFCHECGSKFIITQAKFCMECGVKRIMIE